MVEELCLLICVCVILVWRLYNHIIYGIHNRVRDLNKYMCVCVWYICLRCPSHQTTNWHKKWRHQHRQTTSMLNTHSHRLNDAQDDMALLGTVVRTFDVRWSCCVRCDMNKCVKCALTTCKYVCIGNSPSYAYAIWVKCAYSFSVYQCIGCVYTIPLKNSWPTFVDCTQQ